MDFVFLKFVLLISNVFFNTFDRFVNLHKFPRAFHDLDFGMYMLLLFQDVCLF